ncbi:MAG: hypothetical protein E4H45_00180 [Nitrospirales bacterium]|nr:MAG: hypothetical protein E4H45_00180 [Nitrospirales bacterium]
MRRISRRKRTFGEPMNIQDRNMPRSEFLRMMAATGLGLLLAGCEKHASVEESKLIGPEEDFVEKLFEESFIIDGNVNLGMDRGRLDSPMEPGAIKNLTGIDIGGHTTRVNTLESRNKWVEARSDALLKIERVRDIERARAEHRYGIIYYVQSGFDLGGSLEPLSLYKEGGVRVLLLTYANNEIGGGSDSDNLPLTAFGKMVVGELNRLRMVVDVSHCGKRTTLDAAGVSAQPITANHANAEFLAPNARNKSDEELVAIAATGGVIGATTINRFLMKDSSTPATINDFADQIDYMVKKIGIDHVGVGSDGYMDGTQRYDVDYSELLLNSPSRWKHVAYNLHQRGYSEQDLQKVFGLNYKRVYDTILDP